MALLPINFVSKQVLATGISSYLLIPALPPDQLHGSRYVDIASALYAHIQGKWPYACALLDEVARKDDEVARKDNIHKNNLYIQSCPTVPMMRGDEVIPVRYIGQGNISSVGLLLQDESLWFLRSPPTSIIPPWPYAVTDMNGVIVSESDEFIVLQTVDQSLIKWIEDLPKIYF